MSTSKEAKRRVRAWARDLLGSHSRDSPRCEAYPRCGGEDGSGHLEYGEARRMINDAGGSMKSFNEAYARAQASVTGLPTCKDCKAYAREVERLLASLRPRGDA